MNTPTIYSAAGNGVVKADQHGELVLLSDYLELKRQHDILDKKEEVQYRLRGALAEELKKAKAEIEELRGNPDPLTAYLYASELCKDDIKTLKDAVKRLTLLQVETIDERNKAEAEVERLTDENVTLRMERMQDEKGKRITYADYANLKAEVERLRKAGDLISDRLARAFGTCPSIEIWNAAKEGKPTE